MGRSAVIHSRNKDLVHRFSSALQVSRALLNRPSSQGVGGICTGLTPSSALGCSTFDGNSTTDNVDYHNLLDVERVAGSSRRRLVGRLSARVRDRRMRSNSLAAG